LVFANGSLGLKVMQLLLDSSDIQVVGVVLNHQDKISEGYKDMFLKLSSENGIDCEFFQFSENLWEQTRFLQVMRSADYAVSALFGHIIPLNVISHFGEKIVNLHPSLLPTGRGADPVAWAIIEDKQQGATLHQVDGNIDTGNVLKQIQIETHFSDTAGEIYSRCLEALLELFKQYLASDLNHLEKKPPDSRGTYHNRKELDAIRESLLRGNKEFEHVLRIVQALSYSDGRRARLKLQNGQVWEVSISARLVLEQDDQ